MRYELNVFTLAGDGYYPLEKPGWELVRHRVQYLTWPDRGMLVDLLWRTEDPNAPTSEVLHEDEPGDGERGSDSLESGPSDIAGEDSGTAGGDEVSGVPVPPPDPPETSAGDNHEPKRRHRSPRLSQNNSGDSAGN